MGWSYTSPDASEKDAVRFLIQDTNTNEQLVSDEEIQYVIDRWLKLQGTLEYCAAVVAEAIAARYAREASFSGDGTSINLGQVAQQFRDLAVSLRSQHHALLVGGSPDVGGVSPYEGLTPEVKNFAFGTGMHDDLDAGEQDFGSRDNLANPVEQTPYSW